VMITTRLRRTVLAALLSLGVACSSAPACSHTQASVSFGRGEPAILGVDVADDPTSRARGLMGRMHLGADQGMLFLFDGPSTDPFWMKDTLIPLSVAFFDDARRIIAIREMTPCQSAHCRTYGAGAPYVGAIEANRGYFSGHGIHRGDLVRSDVERACR
jgi:uncharacterized membrane protein (UPF0127 family)